jgi:predicted  nucleic acid-binding Zn-ribbon protein
MEENNIKDLTDEEIRNIKTQYNKAKDILEKINTLSLRYDVAFKSLDTRNQDLERISVDSKERFTTIENLKTEAFSSASEIKSSLEKTQISIDQINDGLQKFENIKGKIESRNGEIDNLVVTANSLKSDIENVKTTAQAKLTEISNQFTQIQDKITKMQEAYNSFVAIHTRITEPKTGLQAILDQSVELQKQANLTFSDIKSFHEQSKKLFEQIKINKSETDKIKLEAKKVLEEINLDQEEVKKITALITDTGFEYAFQKREKILRWSSLVWLIILLASIGGLVWMLYVLFGDFFKDSNRAIPESAVIIFRFALTSPLLFMIGIAIKQYGDERNLNEKYAFKASIAAVIRNHSKFLIEIKDRSGEEIAGFVRETLCNVYSEPYEKGINPKEIQKDLKSALNKKDSNIKLDEIISSTKELKDLIPDNDILKNVLKLFSK